MQDGIQERVLTVYFAGLRYWDLPVYNMRGAIQGPRVSCTRQRIAGHPGMINTYGPKHYFWYYSAMRH
jgi:hypothetical protein